jgi:glycosyltransferase involved in cell wall biosynthesis
MAPRQTDGFRLISVVIPVYNEADNVEPLCEELHRVLEQSGLEFEVLFCDDGSTDGTPSRVRALLERYPRVRLASLRRHMGQTAALSAGFDLARGDVIVTMDGDLQNDPADIPRLLATLKEGYDVVSGWRHDRKDPWLRRRLPSQLANRLISWLSGVPLHDYGCTLKAYRAEILRGIRLYGEMHRFIPIYAAWQGARLTELVVQHRSRRRGQSKYGMGRTFRVVLDLALLKFLDRYAQRPMHLFGGFGWWSFAAGILSFGAAVYFKMAKLGWLQRLGITPEHGKDFVETPLPLLVVLFFLAGILSILMGLLAEMVMRTYYESQGKSAYLLREVVEAAGGHSLSQRSEQH